MFQCIFASNVLWAYCYSAIARVTGSGIIHILEEDAFWSWKKEKQKLTASSNWQSCLTVAGRSGFKQFRWLGSVRCWATDLLAPQSILPMPCQFCYSWNEAVDVVSSLGGKCMENASSLEVVFPMVRESPKKLQANSFGITQMVPRHCFVFKVVHVHESVGAQKGLFSPSLTWLMHCNVFVPPSLYFSFQSL